MSHGTVLCVLMGVCRTNLRMRHGDLPETKSKVRPKKKNSPGPGPAVGPGYSLLHSSRSLSYFRDLRDSRGDSGPDALSRNG